MIEVIIESLRIHFAYLLHASYYSLFQSSAYGDQPAAGAM